MITIRAMWGGVTSVTFTAKHRWFPWGTDNVVLFGTLYAKHLDKLCSDLTERPPFPTWALETFRHEATHVHQQRSYPGGPLAWHWRYLWSATFRQHEEATARREQTNPLLTIEVQV